MPTLLITEGFRFFFFSNEGFEPPHVHFEYGDGYGKFWLQPIQLANSRGLKQQQLRRGRLLVEQHQAAFMEKWREYFGA